MSEPAPNELLVIAAMRRETAALRRRLAEDRRESWSGLPSVVGRLGRGRHRVRVVHCGIGKRAAVSFARRLKSGPPVVLERVNVLVLGLAGGLDPHLELGAVREVARVVDLNALGRDGPECASVELDAPATAGATLITAPTLLVEPAHKSHALRLVSQHFGAEAAGGAMVDMETLHLAAELAGHVRAIRCVRAISDVAATRLPPALAGDSGPSWFGLASAALGRPTLIKELWRLGQVTQRCGVALADWVERTAFTAEAGGPYIDG